jgi:hypothetical protein
MKKIILIICLITISISCKAQDNTIHSNEITINGTQFFGNDVSLVTQYFGLPDSEEDYYYEMQEVMSRKYIYNGILFYIVNSKVDSFEITGSNYAFTSNNIKVGDNISTIQSIYPLSYANKKSNGLMLPFEDMDLFFVISFNNSTNLIDKIALYSY